MDAVAARGRDLMRRFGGAAAIALVVLFWAVALMVKRLARGPIASPPLDAIGLAYLFGVPVLSGRTLVLHSRAARDDLISRYRLPLQAALAFVALALYVVGLFFLDLK